MMVLDDAVADGESQTRADVARLGGEKRSEDAAADGFRDAQAVVLDRQPQPAPALARESPAADLDETNMCKTLTDDEFDQISDFFDFLFKPSTDGENFILESLRREDEVRAVIASAKSRTAQSA